jgi:uncharacterized protein YdeI (YjbR/CyaY-like superfamily)
MPDRPDVPIIELADRTEWERWLDANHASSAGVWLKIAKKGAGVVTVTYAEALQEAIRQGWIDGRRAAHDDTHFLQRFTPRGPRSKWSQINRRAADGLIAESRMKPAGLEQVKAAQADGRWDDAYEPQSRASIPDDFRRALDENPVAREFFATLTGSRRYAFLYRLHHVKRPETRARRIADYIARLSEGRTLQD